MADERIDDTKEYGEHIALCCVNHPEKRWSTKNIGSRAESGVVFFRRSLFYNLGRSPEMGEECDCPASALRVVG